MNNLFSQSGANVSPSIPNWPNIVWRWLAGWIKAGKQIALGDFLEHKFWKKMSTFVGANFVRLSHYDTWQFFTF